jgi:predicted ribosome quality control (RQC) complex YloA/Tae2 family protein
VNQEAKSLTVVQFEKLCEELTRQRAAYDDKAEELKEEGKKLQEMENKILMCLKELELDSYKSKHGTVSITHRTSFTVPKDPEAKAAFFEYLRDRGVYDSLVTVNSQTLNSFCKAELEAAIEEGRGLDFQIPGIGEHKVFESISFRKAK